MVDPHFNLVKDPDEIILDVSRETLDKTLEAQKPVQQAHLGKLTVPDPYNASSVGGGVTQNDYVYPS